MENNEEEKIIEQYIQQREKQTQEEEANEELLQKRMIIKEHIVDQYQGNQEILEEFAQFFIKFIKEHKGIETEQHNLELLTLTELQDIVNHFKQAHSHSQKKEEEPIDLYPELITGASQMVETPVWSPKKVYYSNGAWDYQLHGYQECQKEKSFYFNGYDRKNIIVEFKRNYLKKRGGFLGFWGTLELWVEIKNNIFEEAVERTIEDFIFLRKALKTTLPFTFIPPLNVTDKDLENIEKDFVRNSLINECLSFINNVCKNEQLFENYYTFRFFRELKYPNYIEHKKKLSEKLINHVKLLKNTEGCVEIELSDANEVTKKDYSKKSEQLQKLWKNVRESNTKIVQKLEQVQQQIDHQKKQFQVVLVDIMQTNQAIHSQCYQKFSDILIYYNDIYKVYKEKLVQYQELFTNINAQLAQQAQATWTHFNNYKNEVNQFSHEYQARRKAFLQKQLAAVKHPKSSIEEIEVLKIQQKHPRPMMSMVSVLGVQNFDERQQAWINRYSKWQGYINKQFTLSFQKLMTSDIDILTKIIKEQSRKALQTERNEEQQIVSYLTNLGG